METFMVLQNKKPVWNDGEPGSVTHASALVSVSLSDSLFPLAPPLLESNSYVLDFRGRVTKASVKNFQLVHESDEKYIIMQFGRVGDDEFTMDYRFPMSAVQVRGLAFQVGEGEVVRTPTHGCRFFFFFVFCPDHSLFMHMTGLWHCTNQL